MSQFEQKSTTQLKIETIKSPEGGEVSFCPERGGIITSLKFNNKEILYLDEETFNNKEASVKGGIPILFPNAGPIPEEIRTEEFANLKQHGFARDSKWSSGNSIGNLSESLVANDDTKKMYPYDFKLSMNGTFEKDGSFTLGQNVENLEKDKELPISMGLHPYFKVSNEQKSNVEFDFKGGDFVKENIGKWANGKYISIENPGIEMRIKIPNVGTLVLNISKEYKRVWVWSLPGKDFICIEPVMRDVGDLINDPEKIKPGEIYSLKFNIRLDENQS